MASKVTLSDDAVSRLVQGGMAPRTIAHLFELNEARVMEVARATPAYQDQVVVEDLQRAMQALTLRAIEEIMVMLDEGSPALKQRLLTNMFGKIVGVVTAKDETNTAELRQAMSDMFKEITGD